MKEIKLGNNLSISQVVAGCMRIADANMEGKELLDFASACIDMGVTTFDHAPVYGGYTCERLFGDAVLRKSPKLREKMQIVTKTGIVLPGKNGNKCLHYNSTKEEIDRELEASLKNLGTDYIDLLLVHRPDILGNPEETANALNQLVEDGKVRYIGVSNYMPSQIKALKKYMKHPIVANQVELSVSSTENFFNGTLDDAFENKMPLMAWSPLGGGAVFYSKEDQAVRLRTKIEEIAKEHQVTVDTIMYAWLFTHPLPIGAITGTININRIQTAVKAAELNLTYDEWYQILEASRGYAVP